MSPLRIKILRKHSTLRCSCFLEAVTVELVFQSEEKEIVHPAASATPACATIPVSERADCHWRDESLCVRIGACELA